MQSVCLKTYIQKIASKYDVEIIDIILLSDTVCWCL